jgi:hypothetical protein
MKISELIDLLESELESSGDVEVMVYDSMGDRINPKGFSYGGMSTAQGFVDTVSFSEPE